MTDFTRWLYAEYIKPQLEERDATGYEASLSLMETTLDEGQQKEYAGCWSSMPATRSFWACARARACARPSKTPSKVLF